MNQEEYDSKVKEYHEAFSLIDKDGDGDIATPELVFNKKQLKINSIPFVEF
jgi:Ca2+-binding EF-hand superfamily protein